MKNYSNFIGSIKYLDLALKTIFDCKELQSFKQVVNGFSHLSEDETIASFILCRGLPEGIELKPLHKNVEDTKVYVQELTEMFLSFCKEVYID